MTIWKLLARFAARPAVANWLIRRAMKTPFSHLPSNEDPSYMERYWLFNPYPISSANRKRWQFPWSIRIHHIKRCDFDRDLHDHPWNARTMILKGHYIETRLDRAAKPTLTFWRKEGDTAKLAFNEYHQINEVSDGGVWTLFITGPWRGVWGFLVDGAKVPWRTYLNVDDTEQTAELASDPVVQDVADQRVTLTATEWADKHRKVEALGRGVEIHAALEKIRINTVMFPPLKIGRFPPLTDQQRIDQKRGLNGFYGRISPTSLAEVLKDIAALEEIYRKNPQLEAMVGDDFHIRAQDRDDDGLVDPEKFGTPDKFEAYDPFGRLMQEQINARRQLKEQGGDFDDQRRPHTAAEWAAQYNPNHEFGNLGWSGQKNECAKLAKADQRQGEHPPRVTRHPLENITEWRKGCSCAPDDPADCNECTTALIDAIEAWFKQQEQGK